MTSDSRIERDSLGEREIVARAYYGIHTVRALENFPVSRIPLSFHPELVTGLAMVKKASAEANRDLGLLDGHRARCIGVAAEAVIGGRFHNQFPVDVLQGGAGACANMNANEVIANVALETMGRRRGEYDQLDPVRHVNLSQSPGAVFPAAARIAVLLNYRELTEALRLLCNAFRTTGQALAGVVTVGRTQLQDAAPVNLGRQFAAFATTICEEVERVEQVAVLFRAVSLGGSPAGPKFSNRAVGRLGAIAGVGLISAPDPIQTGFDCGAFITFSGILKRIAVKVSRICNDLRLLSSGPRAGLGEIRLPRLQADPAWLPGRVDPVIPEMVNQVAFEIVGSDLTVTLAAESGQLQVNAFGPLMVHRVLASMRMLTRAMNLLRERCVDGITADTDRCRSLLHASIASAAPLDRLLGKERARAVAERALAEGRTVREVVVAEELMSGAEFDRLLDSAGASEAAWGRIPAT